MSLPFLEPGNEDQGKFLLSISMFEILRSAVAENVIRDDDLATVPEVMPHLVGLVGTLRDDLYKHHQTVGKSIQFPLVANCFGYAFAKGAEAAAQWHSSKKGQISVSYLFEDAIKGAAGAKVSPEFAEEIAAGMQAAYNVFVDFQNNVVAKPELGFAQGGRLLADVIACGFFWSAMVGLDYGMAKLGYP